MRLAALLRGSRGDAVVLLVTFLLTIFRGLGEAIVVGFALGSALFIHRMSRATAIATHTAFAEEARRPTRRATARQAYDETIVAESERRDLPDLGRVLLRRRRFDRLRARPHRTDAPRLDHRLLSRAALDSTAANTLGAIARKAGRHRVLVVLTATTSEMREEFAAHGVEPPLVRFETSIEAALAMRGLLSAAGADAPSTVTDR